eukprot:gene20328-26388_t
MMQKHILQVDGGGVRGAYASAVLNKIHDILQEHNMGQISDFFKGGMSGTSTGSFIVLGLAAKYHKCRNNEQETREAKQIAGSDFTEGPYTPLEILQFYHKKSRFIFDSKSCCYNVFCNSEKCCDTETTHCFSICSCSIPHWLNVLFTCNRYCHNCNGYCGPKYDNTALKKSLVDQFGNMTLKDVIVPVQIVAYNLGSNSPVYFTSQTHPDVKMVDAALASAAAPTYFEAITMDHPSGFSTYVDGGLVDNSSALASIRFCIENFDRNNKQNLGKTSVFLTEKTEKDLVMSDFSEEYLRKILSENNSNIRMVDSAGIVGKILTLEKIVLVSVGTGEVTQATRTEKLKTAGKIGAIPQRIILESGSILKTTRKDVVPSASITYYMFDHETRTLIENYEQLKNDNLMVKHVLTDEFVTRFLLTVKNSQGLTQERLATIIGVSQPTVSRFLGGDASATLIKNFQKLLTIKDDQSLVLSQSDALAASLELKRIFDDLINVNSYGFSRAQLKSFEVVELFRTTYTGIDNLLFEMAYTHMIKLLENFYEDKYKLTVLFTPNLRHTVCTNKKAFMAMITFLNGCYGIGVASDSAVGGIDDRDSQINKILQTTMAGIRIEEGVT